MAEFERQRLIVEVGFGDKPFPIIGKRKIAPSDLDALTQRCLG